MYFNSLHFAAFFTIVLALVTLLRTRVATRNWILLVASYYFYGCWDWRFLGLIAASTLIDYACARALDDGEAQTPRASRDRGILMISVAANLGILGVFKYYDFFATSLTHGLEAVGLHVSVPLLRVVLPVGISFYTFQTLGYTIDVYRRRVRAELDIVKFANYVAFFPQLVAGPIERADSLLPQFEAVRRIDWRMVYSGFWLICWGLFKKVVLADNLATVADAVFAADDYTGLDAWLGGYAFLWQLYCDFSGYTDIARGSARMMGFELTKNFDLPFFVTNPADFWARWHISLGAWFRDYYFFLAAGRRPTPLRSYWAIISTMTLIGLWHGAAWNFVIFGLVHGVWIAGHRGLRPWLRRLPKPTGRWRRDLWFWAQVFVTWHALVFTSLMFRAQSAQQLWDICGACVTRLSLTREMVVSDRLITVFACIAFILPVQIAQFYMRDAYVFFRIPAPLRAVVYALLALAFLAFGEFSGDAFIYFQF
ncbi:MAG: MBOAT family protein [Phycisphaerales bacterium]|nr:MBOAT family protein [Phycisphaerales bacterium]